jgi:eukaryotic-like serine/threonine-protein kinase
VSERWRQIEDIFHRARECDANQRSAFLDQACGDDLLLRREVESLLASDTGASAFMNTGSLGAPTELLAHDRTVVLEGRHIGPYTILSRLGAGGMGEVYRAHDPKLRRDVAIKVLPSSLMFDPDRVRRLEREARLLAALNHSNIATIHGLEDWDGRPALVMELIEGATLAERIAQGPLAPDEALKIALQIAEALEAAHEAGILHRDLKPANIKITKDGKVKVLDFGLAKAFVNETAGVDLPQAPAASLEITEGVQIAGTPAYMSPEQARGHYTDKRTDIWAFGCVLYEMLTGQGAFARNSTTDTLAAIVDKEPDWNRLPPATPPAIVRLLRRCLEKDPKRRLHDMADIRIEIDDVLATPARQLDSWAKPNPRGWRSFRFAATLAALGLVAAIVMAGLFYRGNAPRDSDAATRLSISAPGLLTPQTSVAVSPEGRRLAFVSTDSSGRSMLWVRELESVQPRVLPGTEDAAHPFWSPDGRSLAFLAGGKLKRIDLSGGAVLTLADTNIRMGGSWSRNDIILFAPRVNELATVPATGGPISPVPTREGAGWPFFLPDGRHFLFVTRRGANHGLYVGSLDSPETTQLLQTDLKGMYVESGHLLFVRGETLMAQPFDADSLKLSGQPSIVAEGIWNAIGAAQASFSVSKTGVLAYVNSALWNLQLYWFDRGGRSLGSLGPAERYAALPQIAPDGSRMAIARGPFGNQSVWILKLADGSSSRLTFDQGGNTQPIWQSDGTHILYGSSGSGSTKLFVKDVSGGAQEDVGILPNNAHVWDWSRDRRFVVYSVLGSQGAADIWVLPLFGDHKPYPFAQSAFHKTQAQISPDGRWVAYTSYESGRDEVYVDSFPMPRTRRQVSPDGGMQPRWRQNGTELFYVRSDQYLMAILVKDERTLETARPIPLFHSIILPQGSQSIWFDIAYDVTPDGQRFLMTGPPQNPDPPISVVLNWTAVVRH